MAHRQLCIQVVKYDNLPYFFIKAQKIKLFINYFLFQWAVMVDDVLILRAVDETALEIMSIFSLSFYLIHNWTQFSSFVEFSTNYDHSQSVYGKQQVHPFYLYF